MITRIFLAILGLALITGPDVAGAATHYVNPNSLTSAPPYTSWATAATNIQAAVDVAVAGDTVLVTNGIYSTGGRLSPGSVAITLTNRVVITNAITVTSVNGPAVTVIRGAWHPLTTNGPASVRCAYVAAGATLSGFTLTNGATASGGSQTDFRGGGVYIVTNGVVSNCTIVGNVAYEGGGVWGGTVQSCAIVQNRSGSQGGGAYGSVLRDCTISSNITVNNGGGVSSCSLNHCALVGNIAGNIVYIGQGGGAAGCTLTNCTLSGNTSFRGFGGGAAGCTLNNCTLTGNSATNGGGAYGGDLNNCTVVGNLADKGGGTYSSANLNCIVYFNTGSADSSSNHFSSTFTNSCSAPLPSGVGNISGDPQFVNAAGGDYRLLLASPCVDAGDNAFAVGTTDLAGHPRIINGTVDMGAYEAAPDVFVALASLSPVPPYGSWATAATNLQDGIDAALPGATVYVSNGVYATGGRAVAAAMTNRVVIDKAITVVSMNGPGATAIKGAFHPGGTNGAAAVRCVWMTNGASLIGFTLTNGATHAGGSDDEQRGGGLWCQSTNAWVSNCVVTRCASDYQGGGVYQGRLHRCVVTGNISKATGPSSGGGGVYGSWADGCHIVDNRATGGLVGSGGGGAHNSILNNCLIARNQTTGGSDNNGGGGALDCTLNNCTVVYNATDNDGFGGGAQSSALYNSIVYFNTAPAPFFGVAESNHHSCTFFFSCSAPFAGGIFVTANPLLVDATNGNFRLLAGSPCIDAGSNAYAPVSADLDGSPRVYNGLVDIGAYESAFDPEIAVLGTNSALIADGSVTPFTSDGTDFGATDYLTGLVTRTFGITNAGLGALSVSTVTTAGTHAADFSVLSFPSVVSPGTRANLTIRFNPGATGTRTATITVNSSDADEAVYDFAVQGSGLTPPVPTNIWINEVFYERQIVTPDTNEFLEVAGPAGTVLTNYLLTVYHGPTVAITRALSGVLDDEGCGLGAVAFGFTNMLPDGVGGAALSRVSGGVTSLVRFISWEGSITAGGGPANGVQAENIGSAYSGANPISLVGTGRDYPYFFWDVGSFSSTSTPGTINFTNGANAQVIEPCVITPTPEIAVQGTNDVLIADGDATPAGEDGTDFGSADTVTGLVTRTFSITNSGTANLAISAAGLSGANAAEFSISSYPSIVGAGTKSNLVITFDPAGGGVRAATVQINNNDADEAAYDFAVQGTGVVLPQTYYVATNGSDAAAGLSWATAKQTIQAAIDAATSIDTVLVSNGVYAAGGRLVFGTMSNRVAITKPIRVQSVNGPALTVIRGAWDPLTTNGDAAVRCAYVTNGATLAGFLLTNGATRTGGDAVLEQSGGGVWCETNAVLSNCVISGNSANTEGGGAFGGTLSACAVSGNRAARGGGAALSILNNCLVVGNSATNTGGGTYRGTLNNCTVAGNLAIQGGGTYLGSNGNTIVYFNTAATSNNYSGSIFLKGCSLPLPPPFGTMTSISNDPEFVNAGAGDYHLMPSSPCIEAGSNHLIVGTADLDDLTRIFGVFGDMGAYEFQGGAPVVTTRAASAISASGCTLNGSVIPRVLVTAAYFEYGTSIVYGSTTATSSLPTVNTTRFVSNAIAGLLPATLYHFRIVATNSMGVAYGDDLTFTTWPLVMTNFVALAGTNPVAPYGTWGTAATNIQDAIDAAVAGATVMVSNGVYQAGGRALPGDLVTNCIVVNKPIAVESANGAAVTSIDGRGTNRCAYLTNGVSLVGFTLTNGRVLTNNFSGGGAYCETGAVLRSCVISSNFARQGGGVYQGTLTDCIVTKNTASTPQSSGSGGGVQGCVLSNCMLIANQTGSKGSGGGAYSSTLINCLVVSNTADSGGGATGSTLENCTILNNTFGDGSAVAGCQLGRCLVAGNQGRTAVEFSVLTNCLVVGNQSAVVTNVPMGTLMNNRLVNCTVVGNSMTVTTGTGGSYHDTIINSIVQFNTGGTSNNYYESTFTNSCTTPLPVGPGNFTNAPQFVNLAATNLHLLPGSPCINTGTNTPVTSTTDLAGHARIVGGTVDMGAYEFFISPTVTTLAATNITLSNALLRGSVNPNGTNTFAWFEYGTTTNYGSTGTPTNLLPLNVEIGLSNTISGLLPATLYNFRAVASNSLAVIYGSNLTFATPALVNYVALGSTNPVSPYATWETAATNIQDALDVAITGATVLVSNGVYQTGGRSVLIGTSFQTNRIIINKPLLLKSVNGPDFTAIVGSIDPATGSNGTAAVRCCAITTNGVSLTGFTLTNGWAAATASDYGGGIWCSTTNGIISNCVVTACWAPSGAGVFGGTLIGCAIVSNLGRGVENCTVISCTIKGNRMATGGNGGGAYFSALVDTLLADNSAGQGGGASDCTLNNCTIISNQASSLGGGVIFCTLTNCTLAGNTTASSFGGGGSSASTLYNCLLTGNGNSGASGSTLNNCTIVGNSGLQGGGARFSTLIDCLVVSNTADLGGGMYEGSSRSCSFVGNVATNGGGGALGGRLTNCIVRGNLSLSEGGGANFSKMNNCLLTQNSAAYGGGSGNGTLVNCTVVSNSASISDGGTLGGSNDNCIVYFNSAPIGSNQNSGFFTRCCTTPLPAGTGNISGNPQFVNVAGGNFRLLPSSPCINAGDNVYALGTNDLAGNARIVGGTVDMGAYEYFAGQDADGDSIPDEWELANGLDAGAANSPAANADDDWMTDFEEYIADTGPTNGASVFPPALFTNLPSVTMELLVNPTSTSRVYEVFWTTNLLLNPQIWAPYGTAKTGTGSSVSFAVTNDAPDRTYRTNVRLP